jgi:hypothetical protein
MLPAVLAIVVGFAFVLGGNHHALHEHSVALEELERNAFVLVKAVPVDGIEGLVARGNRAHEGEAGETQPVGM